MAICKMIVPPFMIFLIFFISLSDALSSTYAPSSKSLNYQGRILNMDGTPFEKANVSFLFQILDPSGACIIYQEQVDAVNMEHSKGLMDIPIGHGSQQYISGGSSSVIEVFNNASNYQCGSCSSSGGSYVCTPSSSSQYNPISGAGRLLRVSFYDGTGWNTIQPDNEIRAVPFAGYSMSAQKLGDYAPASFVLKDEINGNSSCTAGSFLTWNSTSKSFGCASVSSSLGTSGVTAGLYGSATQIPRIQVDSQGRITSATNVTISGVAPGGVASGDLSGNYPGPTVSGLVGTPLNITSAADGQILKYNAGSWVNGFVQQSDVQGLSATLGGYVSYSSLPTCNSAAYTLSFISPVGGFACTAISITGAKVSGDISGNAAGFTGDLAGDVTGKQNTTVVSAIQGKAIATAAPINGQVLQWDGTSSKWTPTTIATTPSGAAGGDLVGTYPNPTLGAVGTAGTYGSATQVPVITTDSKGRVTAVTNTSITPSWSSITSKPTTLGGFGITDPLVSNAGNAVSIQAGAEASKGSFGTTGRFYVATDSKVIYYDDGGSWVPVASNSGAGGTVQSVSVVSGNGFAGTVATSTTTPSITLSTTVTGIMKGNGSAIAAATSGTDYAPGTAALATGLLKSTTSTGALSIAGSSDVISALGYTPVNKAGDTMADNLIFASGKGTQFKDSGSNTVTVQAPNSVTSYVLKLPSGQSTGTQALVNDGSGNLSWQSLSAGSVTSVSATSPLSVSGTTTPTVSIGGLTGLGTANQILGMNSGATGYEYKTVNGTANRVTVSHGANAITISTPQDIASTSSPTFAGLTLSGMSTAGFVKNTAGGVLSSSNAIGLATDVSGILPIANGGTGMSSVSNYSAIATNGSGAMTSVAGSLGNSVLSWTASGLAWTPYSLPVSLSTNQLLYASSGTAVSGLSTSNNSVLVTNGSGVPGFSAISSDIFSQYVKVSGRSGGQTLSGGTGSGESLTLDSTTHAAKGNIALNPTSGNVGVGMTSPTAKLDVQGGIVSRAVIINSGATVDLATGNVFLLKSLGTSTISLSNIVSGGSYTFIVTDSNSRTYTFNGCTNSYFYPSNSATQASSRTTYTLLAVVDGANTDCYISWISGFN